MANEHLKPGRELDALVAEKVMGAKPVKTVWGKEKQYFCWSLGEPDWYDDQGASELFNPLPPYSTDIAAAFEVAGKFDNYEILSYRKGEPQFYEVQLLTGDTWTIEHGPTLPAAVCLAALKAVCG